MFREGRFRVFAVGIAALSFAFIAEPVCGQQLRTAIEARARVFETVGPGVAALKRDSAGRYYVLAKPATEIFIYDSNGNPAGQIPNVRSQDATIKYAVDIDLSSDGLLYVADRGANAVEIFKTDGTPVAVFPVNAPTSLATLSNGQFAVTSLTSDQLVQIRNERGALVRSFGDPSNITDDDTAKTPLKEWGKISGDSGDGIYFALTSVDDPTLRKYDRYGYSSYETTVPESVIEAAANTKENRAELSVSMSHLSLSEQTVGSITLGSARDLKFSAGMGTGLLGGMRYGGGFGRASMQTRMLQTGNGDSPFGGGPLGGTVSGQISDQGPQFALGLGSISGTRHGAQAGGATVSQTESQGAILQYNASGTDQPISFTSQDLNESLSFSVQQSGTGSDLEDNPFGSATYQPEDAYASGAGGQYFGQGGGLPADFVIGSMMNSFSSRPMSPSGGFGGGMHGGADAATSAAPSTGASEVSTPATGAPTPVASGAHTTPGAVPHTGDYAFKPHGRFGAGETGVAATVRVNLGGLNNTPTDKAVITAVGIDPATHDIWAGIGDTLVHFNKSGDPLEIYSLTMRGGAPLKPTAILVEPDRFLIAADPWGIFEFARPDKPTTAVTASQP